MIKNYKCSFYFIPTDINPADIATQISQPREKQQQLWWHGQSLTILEESMITNEDLMEPYRTQFSTLESTKNQQRVNKPEDTLETKTLG